MKKMLTLVLILAVASLANATNLTWSTGIVNLIVGNSQTVQLVASDALNFSDKWVGADPSPTGVAQIMSITALAAAGGNAVVQNPGTTGYPGWWVVSSVDSAEPFTIAAGNQYDVVVKGLAVGSYTVTSEDGATYQGRSLLINVAPVPEPITMSLLGLGGLFLRKRK